MLVLRNTDRVKWKSVGMWKNPPKGKEAEVDLILARAPFRCRKL